MERRAEDRKDLDTIEVEQIIDNHSLKKLFSKGHMVNTSLTGFLLTVQREDILNDDLRGNLNLDPVNGTSVSLYIPNMDLELDGNIKLTRHKGNGLFEVLIHFSSDTPRYWRECLMDLLPHPGELD